MNEVTINKEQRLYVIKCVGGFTTLGFDVVKRKVDALEKEFNVPRTNYRVGMMPIYKRYLELVDYARVRFEQDKKQTNIDLNPILLPYVGKRISCVNSEGFKEVFSVGKSTGYIPCLLQLHNNNSSGGWCISVDAKYTNIQVI
jgi:hypothetical protein